MTRADLLRSWFVAPPLEGKWVLLWIFISLPVATVIRSSMHCQDALGECCTPFFIFVLLSAILLGTWAALVAVVASTSVSLLLFAPPAHSMVMSGEGEVWGITLFIFYCLLIVGAVEFFRHSFARFSRLAARSERSSGIIFSLEKGQAWASWPGGPSPVHLGPEHEVTTMMQDFVAQVELGKRMADRAAERRRVAPA